MGISVTNLLGSSSFRNSLIQLEGVLFANPPASAFDQVKAVISFTVSVLGLGNGAPSSVGALGPDPSPLQHLLVPWLWTKHEQ